MSTTDPPMPAQLLTIRSGDLHPDDLAAFKRVLKDVSEIPPGRLTVMLPPMRSRMKPPAPPRVDCNEAYWSDPPPQLSARCSYWVLRFAKGWRPGRRIRHMGYQEATFFYGVYVWEFSNVLAPMLRAVRR